MQDQIHTLELFPVINQKLLELLNSLTPEDFHKPTQFPSWKVKDICAHLLDTSIRRLSSGRDHYHAPEQPQLANYEQLLDYVTRLADSWALAFSAVSPGILIELTGKYQNELVDYLASLEPFERAAVPVSWAGETASFNWFDIAREYTERWHHQMQIREALGREPLYARRLYTPVLDTFLRALPYHYRDWRMAEGYVLCVTIEGAAGGQWFLEWHDQIELNSKSDRDPQTTVSIQQEDAWKIFTRWTDKSIYRATIHGNQELGQHLLQMNCLLIRDSTAA